MKARKLLCALLCLVMIFALAVPAFAAKPTSSSFTDTKGNWAEHEIALVADAGIVGGYPDGSFRPNNNITREAFAKVVANFMGFTEEADLSQYTDVDPKGALTPYVARCVAAGVMGGYSDTRMAPKNNITREQAAAMLCRAFKLNTEGLTANFTDADKITPKLQCEVAALELTGLITGYQAGDFRPKANLTRAQMMVIISRLLTDENGNFGTVSIINKNGSDTVTVFAEMLNDYSLRINVPDKTVDAGNVSLKASIKQIPGMDKNNPIAALILAVVGNIERSIETGIEGTYAIRDLAYNAFKFNFGTIRLSVNGNQCIFNVLGEPQADGSVTVLATPSNSKNAETALLGLMDMKNVGFGFIGGNYITIAEGSYLQVGTERLGVKSKLLVNYDAAPEAIAAAIENATELTTGNTEVDQVTIVIKKGTVIATDKGAITLNKDVTVTINGVKGEYEGMLSDMLELKESDVDFIIALANELMASYSGGVVYVDVKIA